LAISIAVEGTEVLFTVVLQIKSLCITKVDSILAQYETVLVLDRAARRPLPQVIKTLQ